MGDDQCFYISQQDEIIACVIISFTSTTPFLHALVVNKTYQHKGLATQLVIHGQKLLPNICCFADINLSNFYQKLGFERVESNKITVNLQTRFYNYQRNNNKLAAFQFQAQH